MTLSPPLPAPAPAPAAVKAVDARFLQSLVGFNARMASLKIIGQFVPRMAQFGLRVVDFSILSLIHHNPGITSRQLCDALNLLPPTWWARSARWSAAACCSATPTPWTGERKACC